MFIGFDPGKDKCGVALVTDKGKVIDHQVMASSETLRYIQSYLEHYQITALVMGNQTTSKKWKSRLETELHNPPQIIFIDERNSSLEARGKYWQFYPPKGLQKLIPQGMRLPPRPIDDLVAILLVERYLESIGC